MSEHCSACGAAHQDPSWPKTCPACGRVAYRNPTPVAVLLQPVTRGAQRGLLTIRRGIEPRLGELALPGGYVDWAEDWRAAAARELREETQLEVDPRGIVPFAIHSPPDGRTVLLFGLAPALEEAALGEFVPTAETQERAILWAPGPLAFPLHTQVAAEFFARPGS